MRQKGKYVLPLQVPDSVDSNTATNDNNGEMFKRQAFAVIAATLGGLSMGAVGGYTSPALEGIGDRFMIGEQELSLVTSVAHILSLPGGFLGGALSEYFGRRLTMIIICVVNAIGWLLLGCAPNLATVDAGRAVTGLGQGMVSACTPVYIAEVTSPSIRGKLGSGYQFFVAFGILYVYVLGAYLTWQQLAIACLAVSALQAVLMLIIPETPYWYKRHGYEEDAAASLKWLGRSDTIVVPANDNLNVKSLVDPALLKPLLIIFILMFVEQCSGITVVIVYAVSIFKTANVTLDNNVSSIIVASSQLAAVVAAYFLVDRLGRRILLIISAFFMAVGMISLGAYYYVRTNDPDSIDSIQWLPVAALVMFVVAYGIGFGPIPWIMMGELFPTKARGIASGISTTLKWTMTFLTAKTYVDIKSVIYEQGAFWLYGGVCVFGFFFALFFVPETKGKSLEELEIYFKGVKKVKSFEESGAKHADESSAPKIATASV